MAWYHGYIKYMQETFDLAGIQFGGISAGCQPCVCLGTNLDANVFWNEWFVPFIKDTYDSRQHPLIFPHTTFMDISRELLRKIISEESVARNSTRIHLATTNMPLVTHTSESNFTSFDDLFDCIVATQYVPFICGPMTYQCRGNNVIDGGVGLKYKNYTPMGTDFTHFYVNVPADAISNIFSLVDIGNMEFHNKLRNDGYEAAKHCTELHSVLDFCKKSSYGVM